MRYVFTFLSLSACNFIGDKDQKSRLDPDKDGVLWPDDCNDNNPNIGGPQTWFIDEDGDGFGTNESELQSCAVPQLGTASGGDCDDSDPDSYPTAVEVWYNGVDNDCLGGNDFDADGDGEESSSYEGSDCDDSNAAINSAAAEIFYDGIDQDCDGNLNECDADGDGFNGAPNGIASDICPNVEDCDDTDATIFPNDTEEIPLTGIDEDCNLQTGDGDLDGDGFWHEDYEALMSASGTEILVPIPFTPRDCWDDQTNIPDDYSALNGFPQLTSIEVYPEATDIFYDGIDANCFGDDDFDQDRDGFQSDNYTNRLEQVGEDCDDEDTNIFPGAIDEYYDGINANCDSLSDFDQDLDGDIIMGLDFDGDGNLETTWDFDGDGIDDFIGGNDCNDIDPTINSFEFELPADGVDQDCNTMELCYIDGDNDSYGTTATGSSNILTCLGSGFSTVTTDCDDSDTNAHPGSAFNDSISACMLDSDGDGYGDASPSSPDVIGGSDCDDNDSSSYPSAPEIIDDGIDQDCDGGDTCYQDADNDGFRNQNTNLIVISSDLDCNDSGEGSTLEPPDDCSDSDSTIYPGAAALEGNACMIDSDGDGYGSSTPPVGVDAGSDCNDSNANINPLADEVCDNADNDCDGDVDESSAIDAQTWYIDTDGDGFGDSLTSLISCNTPSGYTTDDSDCDDSEGQTYPGTAFHDSFTECMKDSDGDGYGDDSPPNGVTPGTDCNDSDSSINPSAAETINNGIDDDCNPATPLPLSTSNDAVASFTGLTPGQLYGKRVLSLPLSGEMLAVTAEFNNNQGAFGQLTLINEPTGAFTEFHIVGDQQLSLQNAVLSAMTDINSDGLPELVVGGPRAELQGGANMGMVYILSSGSHWSNDDTKDISDVIQQPNSTYIFHDTAPDDLFGANIHTTDQGVIVSAPGYDQYTQNGGSVRYYSNSNISQINVSQNSDDFDGEFFGLTPDVNFGSHIASGDLDGDGNSDIIIGANGWENVTNEPNRGRVYVFDSHPSTNVSDISNDWNITGEIDMQLGTEFTASNDLNDDGYVDLLIGTAPHNRAMVFLGGSNRFSTPIDLSSDLPDININVGNGVSFGASVSSLGDINGDAQIDIGIGDPDRTALSGVGYIHIIHGPLSSNNYVESDMTSIYASQNTINMGASITPMGDINTDGFDDFAVGAPSFIDNNDAGSVLIFYGIGE